MTTEIKTGLFAVVATVVLLGAILLLRGGITIRERGYDLKMRVANAQGIRRGRSVEMAGVVVGRVKRLELTPDRRAEITLFIREGVTIPTGSRFATVTEGILGDRFIAIAPGPPDAPPIPPDGVVTGTDPFTLEQLADRLSVVARRAEETLVSINRLVDDPELRAGIRETVRNARETTATVRQAAENVERLTRTLERTAGSEVPAIARRLRVMSTDLAEAAGEIKTMVRDVEADGETARQLRETIATVNRAAQRIDKMLSDLQGVINEQEVRAVRASLAEVRSTITEARQGINEARQGVSEVRQGIAEVRQGVAEARGVVGRAGTVIDRVNRIIPERIDRQGLRSTYLLDYELWYAGTRAGHDVRLTLLPGASRQYIFSWRDIGQGNRIGLQIGDRLRNSPLTVRYGLIDGQVGVGLDYGTTVPGFVYSVDLYNVNQPTLNVYTQYYFSNEYGISLRATSLFNTPMLGVGVFRRF